MRRLASGPSFLCSQTRRRKKMPFHTTHRLRSLALAAAVAALAVPAAHGDRAPAGKYGPLDPWAYNAIHRSARPASAGALDPWAYNLVAAAKNRTAPRTAAAAVATASDSFDWRDAGVGAGSAAGLLLLAAGGARVVVRRRARVSSF
jgi:hypothetical protein